MVGKQSWVVEGEREVENMIVRGNGKARGKPKAKAKPKQEA